jgi:hypothetical protein
MIPHAWKCEQLIVLAGLLLVTASIGKARQTPSRLQVNGKTSGADRIALPAVSSDQNPSEPRETAPQLPPPVSASTAEKATTKPLQVTYEEGQLTIIAENSALSDVMKALRAALEMDIDLPASVAEQRIWVHLGPGPARRVLRDLLDGTEFNYVIQASESDVDGIRSVMLSPRSKSAGSTDAPRMAERASANRSIPRGGSGEDASDSESLASAEPVVPSAAAPVNPSVASMNQPPTSISPQNVVPNSSSSASSTSSSITEQMIQQLQSMYQQRRQIQMQQNQIQQNQKPPVPAPNQ